MDADLLTLFSFDGRVAEISPKAVITYLIFRADIISRKGTEESKQLKKRNMLASSLSISDVSSIAGFSELEIKNSIDELIRKKLLTRNDTYYQLGDYKQYGEDRIPNWYCLETKSQIKEKQPEKERNSINFWMEKIRKRAKRTEAERRAVGANLEEETKQKIIHDTMKEVKKEFQEKTEKPTKTLFMLFRKLHMKKFGTFAKFATGELVNIDDPAKIKEGNIKTSTYMLRFFKYFNESMEAAEKTIQYVFDNWEDIKLVMNLGAQYELNVGLLTSRWFMEKVKLWQANGIPTWKLNKKPTKSNERINRKYESSQVEEDFGTDSDAGDSLPGEFG